MTDERLKIWLGFWKWLISSVVITGGIAWATTIINAKHKDTELAIKVNQEEKEYLTSFLERALDDNLEKRHRFAQYFANVTSSNEYKQGWKNYLNSIEKELEEVKAEKESLIAGLSNKSGEELRQAKLRIADLEKELVRSISIKSRQLKTHQIDSLETITSYKLACPENSTPRVWSEIVSSEPTPDFPKRAYYITYGCRDDNGNGVGPFVSWYPNGQLIQEGIVGGDATLYYPDGKKASVARNIAGKWLHQKGWNTDGTLID